MHDIILVTLCLSFSYSVSECSTSHSCFMRGDTEVCYSYHGNQNINWTQAEQFCNQVGHGGHLASVHNEKETRIMYNLSLSIPAYDVCWIGLHDPILESISYSDYLSMMRNQYQWQWIDESTVDYTHWWREWRNKMPKDNIEPSWNHLKQTCVEAYFNDGAIGDWNNGECSEIQKCFICQYFTQDHSNIQRNQNVYSNSTILILTVLLVMVVIVLIVVTLKYVVRNVEYSWFHMFKSIVANIPFSSEKCPSNVSWSNNSCDSAVSIDNELYEEIVGSN